jgi:SAM-dependent methyltransferase
MRDANLPRLSSIVTHDGDLYYLHYRSLFAALEKAAAYARGNLLDIGCGNKPYEALFRQVTHYIGFDIVQSSERRADLLAHSTSIPLADETFDTVFSSQVIEHVSEPTKLFAEAFRVLRRGGHFLVTAPMYWHLHEEPYDFYRYTKHGIRYLFESAGFEVIDIMPNGGKWAVCGQVMLHTIQSTRFDRGIIIRCINRIFAYLDDIRFDDSNTINYVAIAKKP